MATAASKGKGRKQGNTDMKLKKRSSGSKGQTQTQTDGAHAPHNAIRPPNSRKRGTEDARRRSKGQKGNRIQNGDGGGGGKRPKFDLNEEIVSSSDEDSGNEGKKSKVGSQRVT